MTQPQLPQIDRPAARAIVSNHHRRRLVCHLEHGETVSVAEAVRRLGTRDQQSAEDDAAEPTRQQLRLALVHNHLPRLDDHDVLEYDPNTNEITLTAPLEYEHSEAVFETLLEPALEAPNANSW
ncbi:DUF7344 domain-containing protein [Natronolimnobius baerhuensis]|uniref:DUF7344 domain-containing protein n=1 Tax=Natronolimnobius baerhuensis TaxID=253108 RepID=A0A202EAY3_9EURY|nr:hypothetical protein [Natronolimnobius baerhuensis]OVE85394.1 hypothetical protein B2G88_00755 [Natronolimnobius baerhuensis]